MKKKIAVICAFLVLVIAGGFIVNIIVATKVAQIRIEKLNEDLNREGWQISYNSIKATFIPNRIVLEDVKLKSITSEKPITYKFKKLILENIKFEQNKLTKGRISYTGDLYESFPQAALICIFIKCPERLSFSGFVDLKHDTEARVFNFESKLSLEKMGSVGIRALFSNIDLEKKTEPLLHRLEIEIEDHGIGNLIIAAFIKKKDATPQEIQKERERLSSSEKLVTLSTNPNPVIRKAVKAIRRFISGESTRIMIKLSPPTPLPVNYAVKLLQKGDLNDWEKLGLTITN